MSYKCCNSSMFSNMENVVALPENKIKVFLCRVRNDTLPVKVKLAKRRADTTTNCQICGEKHNGDYCFEIMN